MAKDPYKILGVARSASDKDIQKAYRALAKKYHPDVNKGDAKTAEKFKEISAAYTLLSDKNLRSQYDSGQVDGSGQQQNPFAGGGGFGRGGQQGGFQTVDGDFGDMGDLLQSLFGMQMGGRAGGAQRTGHPFTRQRATPPQKGTDMLYQLQISFADAVKGGVKQLQLQGGKSLKVKIPEGAKDGTVLRLRGKGGAGSHGGKPGDAKITLKVGTHKYMRRDGDNLRLDLPITLKEAVLGGKVRVPTPHGDVSLRIAKGSSSGTTLRLKGKGVNGGDLLVKLLIILPKKV